MSAPSDDRSGEPSGALNDPDARGRLVNAFVEGFARPLRAGLAEALEAEPPPSPLPLPPAAEQTVVLAGHRAAGKSRALPVFEALLGRRGIDLDRWIETRHRRNLKGWVRHDPQSFRKAEREAFLAQPPGSLISVGGGFLSLHADLLAGAWTVLIPIDFETYAQRLRRDRSRPRLRPELSLTEELREVYEAREAAHAKVPTHPLWAALRILR